MRNCSFPTDRRRGWTTQTILFSGGAGQMADGEMHFFGVDGSPFDIVLE